MSILRVILLLFRALFRDRSQLVLENLALRQQLAGLRRGVRFQNTRARGRAGPIRLQYGPPGNPSGTPLRGGADVSLSAESYVRRNR